MVWWTGFYNTIPYIYSFHYGLLVLCSAYWWYFFPYSDGEILAQRKRIRELSYEESKKVAEKATTELSTMEEVVELVKAETGIEG